MVAPAISPVQSPQLNARGAFSEQLNLGQHPVVSWSAPSIGTANRYIIRVWTFRAGGSFGVTSDLVIPARVTSVRLPPGVLDPAAWHALEILAIATGGDVETIPARAPLPYGSASIFSGRLAVGAAPF